jgi:hypothetical protein
MPLRYRPVFAIWQSVIYVSFACTVLTYTVYCGNRCTLGNVKLPLCLIKHYPMKMYWRVDV